jgi:hypothetical protein
MSPKRPTGGTSFTYGSTLDFENSTAFIKSTIYRDHVGTGPRVHFPLRRGKMIIFSRENHFLKGNYSSDPDTLSLFLTTAAVF